MSVSEAIPGASRLRNQNLFSIEKSDEALKNIIKKLFFLEFFHFNFLHNLKTFDVVGFLTPHDSRNLTTVKFLESVIC